MTRYNRYGGTFGGPIVLPRFGEGGKPIWIGRDRSFFFFAYEGLKDAFQEPDPRTVPTLAMREGDFSALLPSIVIYDPATARQVGARVQRDPFPNNKIPANRFSPIALNYLKFYPLPNVATNDPLGTNNYFSSNPRSDTFHSESYRFDQIVTEKQRFFVRYNHNNRREARGNWTGEVNGIRPTGNYLFRINSSSTFDHLYNFGPTTILNTRIGFSRFVEKSERQHQGQFNPASLGFSQATAAFFGNASYLPRFEFQNGGPSLLGDSVGDTTTFNIYSAQPTLTRIVGGHSLKMGYDFRSYRENNTPTAQAAGRYDFNNDFTRQLDTSPRVPGGQQFASFLLGIPTGGFIDRNTSRSNQTLYQGFFFHDAAVQTNGVDDPAKQRADQRIALGSNLRYFPSRLPGFRGQNLRLWDISVLKKIRIYERLNLELRGEFLNAFNHVQFSDPETSPTNANFGRVTSQANLPRNVQIGLKLIF